LIQVNDHVDVTLPRGTLIDYVVIDVPGNNMIYWTLAPADDLTKFTVVGPSFLSMVLRP